MLFHYTNITLIAAALQEAGNKSMSQAVGIQAACPEAAPAAPAVPCPGTV